MEVKSSRELEEEKVKKKEKVLKDFIVDPYLHDNDTVDYSYLIKSLSSIENGDTDHNQAASPLKKINELRKEIDECDNALIQIFQRRMELVMEILQNKRENNLPIFHAKREEEIVQKALLNLKGGQYADEIEGFLREIFKISRKLQSQKLFPYNIVLIGFMGTGKSTVGKDLSGKLAMGYIDTDALIQERVGMSINEIFQNYGEPYFRDVEKNIVEEVSKKNNTIIICGGGVVLNKDNITSLRKNGKNILLKAESTTIYERIRQDDTRPLLKGKMSLEGVEKLLKQRNEIYNESADMIIETDDKSVDEISTQIITELYAMEK